LLTSPTGTAASAAAIAAALLSITLRGADFSALEGVVIALVAPGTGAANPTTPIVATFLGEAEDGALRLAATADTLLIELPALASESEFEAERFGVPLPAGLVDAVDQFLRIPWQLTIRGTFEDACLKGNVFRTGQLHHAIEVLLAVLLSTATTICPTVLSLLYAQGIPVVVAAEGIHIANTAGDIGILAAGSIVTLTTVSFALTRPAILRARLAGFALSLLAPTVATGITFTAVFRTCLAVLALSLLAPTIAAGITFTAIFRTVVAVLADGLLAFAIAAHIGCILTNPVTFTDLAVWTAPTASTAAIAATLFIGTLRHAHTLSQVVADRATRAGSATSTTTVITAGLIVALRFAEAATEVVAHISPRAFAAAPATAISSALFANAFRGTILAGVPLILARSLDGHLPAAILRVLAANGVGATA